LFVIAVRVVDVLGEPYLLGPATSIARRASARCQIVPLEIQKPCCKMQALPCVRSSVPAVVDALVNVMKSADAASASAARVGGRRTRTTKPMKKSRACCVDQAQLASARLYP
jgi:hypothetical protein